MKRVLTTLAMTAIAMLSAACGGSSATPAPASVAAASHAPAGSAAVGGQTIDVAGIQAAVAALKAHDSWQFSVTTFEAGTPNFSRLITGTQRTTPSDAVQLTMNQSGQPMKSYVRIADDVWYDAGTGTWNKTTASDNAVISQFEPYYLNGLVNSAESQGYQYQAIGADTIDGVASTHYRLADSFVQDIVKNMNGMTAADWAADVWISTADGSLMRLTWGPQSVDKAQVQAGVDYRITSIDCTCPVDPPA